MRILASIVYIWRTGRLPGNSPVSICPRCLNTRPLPVIAYVRADRMVRPVCLDCAEWEEIK